MEELTKELQKLVESALKQVIEHWLINEFETRDYRRLKAVKEIYLSQFKFDKERSDFPKKLILIKVDIGAHVHVDADGNGWDVKSFGFFMVGQPSLSFNEEKREYSVENASELKFIESSSF